MFSYYLTQFFSLNLTRNRPKMCTFKNLEEIWKKRVATLSLRNISKFLDKLFLTPCSSCNTSLKYTAEGLVF